MQVILAQSILITAVGSLFLLIRWWGRNKISVQLRTVLWGIVLLLCMIPSTLLSTPYGILPNDVKMQETDGLVQKDDPNDTDEPKNFDKVNHSTGNYAKTKKADIWEKVQITAKGLISKIITAVRNSLAQYQDILFGVYLSGLLITAAFLVFLYLKCKMLIRSNCIKREQDIRNSSAIAYLRKQGISFQLTKNMGPCTAGFFRTTLYLPKEMILMAEEKFTGEEVQNREAIKVREDVPQWFSSMILHEIVHKNRFHYQILTFVRLLCVIYWFHPVTWLLLRHLREDMELRCDYEAIIATGEDELSYVESMIYYARLRAVLEKSGQLEVGIPFLKRGGALKKRVKGILSFPLLQNRTSKWITAGTIVLMIATAALLTRKVEISVPIENTAEGFYYFSEEEIQRAKEVVIRYWTAISTEDMGTASECIHGKAKGLLGMPEVEEQKKSLDGVKRYTFVGCEYEADKWTKHREKSEAMRREPPEEAKNVICFMFTILETYTENGVTYPENKITRCIWLLRDDEESDWYVLEMGG